MLTKQHLSHQCWLVESPDLKSTSKQLSRVLPSVAELEVDKEYLQSLDSNFMLSKFYEQKVVFLKLYSLPADIAVIGLSSAICESGFSMLTRIDKPTWRAMLQPKQASLVLLAFKHKLTAKQDLDTFVKRLAVFHPCLELI